MKSNKVAVLITSHNRKEKTLTCLKALHSLILPRNYSLKVYLVDDGSNDGTSEEVKKKFPKVLIIAGNGHLYWNQGMRLAWKMAVETKDYDFYLWLNDDTILYEYAFEEIIGCYNELLKNNNQLSIITGACESFPGSNIFTYGGKIENSPVIPNGSLQKCKYINGNFVLVAKNVFKVLGILSNDYTHTMGDFDYGLRALQEDIGCYTTKKYVASCPSNEDPPAWCNPDTALKKRWKLLHSPKGLNLKEYIKFRQKFWGWKWIIFATKAYSKTLFPKLYEYMFKN
jgi:GT2 family glycosyltransferase